MIYIITSFFQFSINEYIMVVERHSKGMSEYVTLKCWHVMIDLNLADTCVHISLYLGSLAMFIPTNYYFTLKQTDNRFASISQGQ